MKNRIKLSSIRRIASLSCVVLLMSVLAMVPAALAVPQTITWNNASGSGEWNGTATNWVGNKVFTNNDTVWFNVGSIAGNIFIGTGGVPGSVAPGALWSSYQGTTYFTGGDISGTGTVNTSDDGGLFFTMPGGLTFSGGTFAGRTTGEGSGNITYSPSIGGSVGFGTGPIASPPGSLGGGFTFSPTVPMTLTNRFDVTSQSFKMIGNANAQFIGDVHMANNAGVAYSGYSVSGNQTFYLDGLTGTIAITVPNSGTLYGFNGSVSNPAATLNLWSGGSARTNAGLPPPGTWTDYRSGVSATNAWKIKSVNTMGGILFVDRPDIVFSLLRGNGGAVTILNGNLAAASGVSQDTVAGTFNTGPADYILTAGAGGNYLARIAGDTINVTAGGTISGTNGMLFGNTLNINSGSITGAVAVGGPKKADGSLFKFTTANLNPAGILSTTGKVNAVNLYLNGGMLLPFANPIWADTTTVRSAASTITATGNLTGNAFRRTTGGTALFRGANLGGSAKVTFTSGTTLTGGLFPWALADASDTGPGTSFATYTANGFELLAAYDATDDLTNPGNVDLTIANIIANADPDRTNNALRLSSGGGVTIDSARTLTITSGGILAMAGNTGFSGGILAFGSAEGIFHTVGDLAVSSAVTGTNGLTKDGTGTLTLSGANALGNSPTAINAGKLVLGANNALGTNTLTVQPGGVFDLAGFSQTVGGISDNAGQAVGGTITNSGSATTLTINTAGSQTFSGQIDGNLSLVKNGAGTQTLGGSNSFTGGTTLNAGTLGIGNNNALGYGGLTINGGTIQSILAAQTLTNSLTLGGDFTIGGSLPLSLANGFQLTGNRQITVGNTGLTTIQGDITEDGTPRTFTKAGAGTLLLSGTCGWTGQTILSGGALRASIPSSNLRFNGAASDSPVLEANGSFTRSLGTSGETVQWTGTGGFSAYGGPYAIQLNGGSGAVTWNSGSFVPTSHNLIFGSITADNVVTFQNDINLNGANRTVRVVDNASSTNDYAILSGTISGGSTYTLIKSGTGTLRLTGNNNTLAGVEAGDQSAANGIIEFNSAAALGTSWIYGNYSTSLTLKNISGGSVSLPHSFASRNNNYNIYLAGNDIVFNGTITGSGGIPTFYAATGQTNTFNGPITGTPNLSIAAGYYGTFILSPAAGTSGRINALSGCTVGIATNDAFGVLTGAQYTDANGNTTLFAVGANRTISTPVRWGGYNGVQTFSGNYNLTFTTNQNANWYNSNNNVAWKILCPVVTMSGIINEPACANFYKAGAGVLAFTATNTYISKTFLDEGTLRATQGIGLPTNSNLAICSGGVLETSNTFNRTLGTTAGLLQWVTGWVGDPATGGYGTGSGGFAAYGGPLTVDLNTLGVRDSFTWASTASFVPAGGTLVLNSTTATDPVTVYDHIGLNAAVRTVQVNDNPATSNDYAVLSGNLSGTGISGINKTGAGTLFLNGTNSYTNVTTVVAGGIGGKGSLAGSLVMNAGTRFDARIGQTLSVSNLTISTNCMLVVANSGTGVILTHSGTRTGTFTNFFGLGTREVVYQPNAILVKSRTGTVIVIR